MNRLPAWGFAALCFALVPGCCSTSQDARPSHSTTNSYTFELTPPPKRPELTLTKAEIAERLARASRQAESRRRHARAKIEAAEPIEVADVGAEVRDLYAAGERDAADALAARHPGVATWDHAEGLVTIECHYRSQGFGGALELTLTRRPGVEGPLAICFPAGTYGVGEPVAEGEKPRWTDPDDDKRYGHWPSAQDLAFLDARVIDLSASEDRVTFEMPIACASFGSNSPQPDQTYTLHRFEPGSPIDRLLVALCSSETQPRSSETQLAVWLARNDISWEDFESRGGARGRFVTFGDNERIVPRHADAAAKLLLRSGVDPAKVRFFGGAGLQGLDEQGSQPAPAPATEAPVPSTTAIP